MTRLRWFRENILGGPRAVACLLHSPAPPGAALALRLFPSLPQLVRLGISRSRIPKPASGDDTWAGRARHSLLHPPPCPRPRQRPGRPGQARYRQAYTSAALGVRGGGCGRQYSGRGAGLEKPRPKGCAPSASRITCRGKPQGPGITASHTAPPWDGAQSHPRSSFSGFQLPTAPKVPSSSSPL